MSQKIKKQRAANLEFLEVPGDPNLGTILFLHGFGADAYDLLPFHTLYEGPRWIFPQGPLEVGFGGKAWFPVDIERMYQAVQEKKFDEIGKAFPPELGQASSLIDDLLIELAIPRSKLLIGGFSQGAVLAIETALSAPTRSAALMIFSGTLVNQSNWKKWAPLHAKTHFFQSHGYDDPLLPFQKAEELEALLTKGGLRGKMHPFHGGHEIPQNTLHQLGQFFKHLFCEE